MQLAKTKKSLMRRIFNDDRTKKSVLGLDIHRGTVDILYILVRFYPTLDAFSISMTEWNIIGEKKYIGFDNFIALWNDPVFWVVLVEYV